MKQTSADQNINFTLFTFMTSFHPRKKQFDDLLMSGKGPDGRISFEKPNIFLKYLVAFFGISIITCLPIERKKLFVVPDNS